MCCVRHSLNASRSVWNLSSFSCFACHLFSSSARAALTIAFSVSLRVCSLSLRIQFSLLILWAEEKLKDRDANHAMKLFKRVLTRDENNLFVGVFLGYFQSVLGA